MSLCAWHAGTSLVKVLIDNQLQEARLMHLHYQTATTDKTNSYVEGKKSLLLLEAHLLSVCSVIHAVSRQQQHLHLLLQNAITEKNILQTPATLSNLLFIYAANTSK